MAEADHADNELTEADNEFVVQAPKAHYEDTEMDITPMIDITFLLLIFFLVAAKMEEAAAIKLPPADTGGVVSAANSVVLTIVQASGDTIAIYKGGGKVPQNALSASTPGEQEEEVEKYVQERVDNDVEQELHNILIMAEGNVKHGEVSRIAKAAARGAEKQMHVAVKQKR